MRKNRVIMDPVSNKISYNHGQTLLFFTVAVFAGSKRLIQYFPDTTPRGLFLTAVSGSGAAFSSKWLTKKVESPFEKGIRVTISFALGCLYIAPPLSTFFDSRTLVSLPGALKFTFSTSVINGIGHWLLIEDQQPENLPPEKEREKEAEGLEKTAENFVSVMTYPERRLEEGISKGYAYFQESPYYASIRESRPVEVLGDVWDRALTHTENIILSHSSILEASGNLTYVQITAQKVEGVFYYLAYVDPTALSSSAIFALQDVQDALVATRPLLEARKNFYDSLERAPDKVADCFYGGKTLTPLNRYTSPLVFKTSTIVMPREEAHRQLRFRKDQVLAVGDALEKSSFHVLFRAGVHQAIPKVTRFLGQRVVRWYVCEMVGFVAAQGYQYTLRLTGYGEEDELADQEMLATTQKMVSWTLWLLMINAEGYLWNARRLREQEKAKEQYAIPVNLGDNLLANSENQEGIVGEAAFYTRGLVREELRQRVHTPPPQSIWSWGWSYVTSGWSHTTSYLKSFL